MPYLSAHSFLTLDHWDIIHSFLFYRYLSYIITEVVSTRIIINKLYFLSLKKRVSDPKLLLKYSNPKIFTEANELLIFQWTENIAMNRKYLYFFITIDISIKFNPLVIFIEYELDSKINELVFYWVFEK